MPHVGAKRDTHEKASQFGRGYGGGKREEGRVCLRGKGVDEGTWVKYVQGD